MIRTISSWSLFQIQGIIANVLDCMILNQILMAVDEESKNDVRCILPGYASYVCISVESSQSVALRFHLCFP